MQMDHTVYSIFLIKRLCLSMVRRRTQEAHRSWEKIFKLPEQTFL